MSERLICFRCGRSRKLSRECQCGSKLVEDRHSGWYLNVFEGMVAFVIGAAFMALGLAARAVLG